MILQMDGIAALASTPGAELLDRLATVEKENCTLRESKKIFKGFALMKVLCVFLYFLQLLRS